MLEQGFGQTGGNAATVVIINISNILYNNNCENNFNIAAATAVIVALVAVVAVASAAKTIVLVLKAVAAFLRHAARLTAPGALQLGTI